jgi:hypothetical protein
VTIIQNISVICSLVSLKSVFDFFIILERSETRQDKFESILEIIESVVSSPFVKAEADSDRLFCTVFETVCASSLAMCAYQIEMLSDRSSVMNKSNTLFNERRENIFKENIPVFSVQGNRAVFPFSRKILLFI